ncbi:MAG TPA: HlyD family efflux transporter periplasmic adaptor subunit [Gemmatimonadaceae bacterium]|nr:HlyD family efflux transporter periplasmic adaptor subunit [Gemmatimonadaceae bacterium]
MSKPSAQRSASGAKAPDARLPAMREDLRLYPGASSRDGSPTWRVHDALRNAFFEIGWLEFELLARWREVPNASVLIARICAETPLVPTGEDVERLVKFLAENQLLAPGSAVAAEALGRRRQGAKRSWFKQLLHNYLFFRLPLVRPDAFLARTVGLTDIFFTRGFVLLVIVLLGLDLYLLSREWYSFTEAMGRMLTPAAFLYYAVAVTFSKIVHELAHAYAARRYGVRVPTLGVAFLVLWPFLYTDTGETWKLGDRRKQLVIACAGMGAELVLAVFSTLLWALAPEGAAKNIFFVLASTTWIMTLAINLSPFMRFDGYFVLSDLLDFPNLHERSGVLARRWLRSTFFRLDEPQPEPALTPRQRAGLIFFAYVTWLYRLAVFLGIALLVYHMFFKLLGVFLMVLELVWFIGKPVFEEVAYLWSRRSELRIAWRPAVAALVVAVALMWIIPISNTVTAPAILRAQQEHAVYAPFPARVVAVKVKDQQHVGAETELVSLQAVDLEVREKKAEISIASARAELARMPASVRLQENHRMTQEKLAQALVEKQAVVDEHGRQQLRAPSEGRIRDLAPDLVVGRWVSPRQLLMRVVSDSDRVIEAFVDERQVAAIEPGQVVRFYPRLPDRPVLSGTVIAVDKSPHKEITRPLLASVHGGDIAVAQGPRGALVAQDAVFRVTVKPIGAASGADAVVHGSVRIDTGFRFLVENFVYRILSVLIRESGL